MSLRILVRKELKELLSEKTILIGTLLLPLIIFFLFGTAISTGVTTTTQQAEQLRIIFIDNDQGIMSSRLKNILQEAGLTLISPNGTTIDDIQELFLTHNVDAIVVVPERFTDDILDRRNATVNLYTYLDRLSPSKIQKLSIIMNAVNLAGNILGENLAADEGINIEYLKSPFTVSQFTYYRGRIVRGEDVDLGQQYFAMSLAIPLVVVMVAVTAGSIAATSIGLEKEAKTLEMLLTLPVSRLKILFAKLIGTTIIALLGAASFMIGFSYYTSTLTKISGDQASLALYSPTELAGVSVILLGLVLLLAILTTMGLGILAGVLAGDVRGGQQLAGLFQFPLIFLPFIFLLFTDLQDLPVMISSALLLNPMTHLFLAIRAIVESDHLLAAAHISVMLLFMIALLGLAAWLFSGERLITTKIRVRKIRRE